VDWHTEQNNQVTCDYLDGERFAALLSAKGIARDDPVVIYGGKNNWWAAYALWVFSLFGHPDVDLADRALCSRHRVFSSTVAAKEFRCHC
jgi:thiosulfate/3-mercaptopyruvate sulfurtransferase